MSNYIIYSAVILSISCQMCFAQDWYEAEEASSQDYIGSIALIDERKPLADEDRERYALRLTDIEVRQVETEVVNQELEIIPPEQPDEIPVISGSPPRDPRPPERRE